MCNIYKIEIVVIFVSNNYIYSKTQTLSYKKLKIELFQNKRSPVKTVIFKAEATHQVSIVVTSNRIVK